MCFRPAERWPCVQRLGKACGGWGRAGWAAIVPGCPRQACVHSGARAALVTSSLVEPSRSLAGALVSHSHSEGRGNPPWAEPPYVCTEERHGTEEWYASVRARRQRAAGASYAAGGAIVCGAASQGVWA